MDNIRKIPRKRYKDSDICITIWNVLSLYSGGMLKSGLKNLKKHTTDTAAIQVIRWKEHGVSDTGKFTLMYGGNDSNTSGTSLLINKKYKKANMYFEVVDERSCSLRKRSV